MYVLQIERKMRFLKERNISMNALCPWNNTSIFIVFNMYSKYLDII